MPPAVCAFTVQSPLSLCQRWHIPSTIAPSKRPSEPKKSCKVVRAADAAGGRRMQDDLHKAVAMPNPF
jgi:hypothetical protein